MASNKLYLDMFIQSSCGKQVKCSICDCWLPSSAEKFISSHVTGRKHNMELEKKRKRENKLQSSIYVKGFDPLLLDLENELQKYFEEMSVTVKDIYIDKNSSSYGIIELTDKDAVDKVLQCDKGLFYDKKLIIKRREIQKKNAVDTSDHKHEETVTISSLLPDELKEELKKKQNIEDEIKLLMDFFVLTEEEKLLRNLICQLVENVLEELYPGCNVLQFGSSSNGLGEKGCDLDITLIAERLDNEEKVCAEIREIIQRFAPGCKNVSIVQSTKTCSIVKFQHTESNLSVDLSLNNYLALNNTELLKAYMNFDERVSSVTFTIRKWAKCFGLSGRNGYQITQYSLTLLVIYFLQQLQPSLLPCLQECHPFEEVLIGEWNCAFCKRCIKNEDFNNTLTVGELLHKFFVFYSSFDFHSNVIAIHSNSILNRDEVYESVNALHLGDVVKTLKFGSPLVVQDPFKRTHNVTHNLTEDGLKLFLDSVKQACSVWNEEGMETISLMQLFVRKKKCFTRQKQKRKRNRSNIYTISLPNCRHICDKSDNECFDHVKTVLMEDLRMRISDLKVLSDVSEIKVLPDVSEIKVLPDEIKVLPDVSLESTDIKEDETNATLDVSGGIKRALTEVSEITCKKIKAESASSMTFIATAYADTWTNRRKQKRLIQKLKQDNNIVIENLPDINEDADSGITMSDVSNTNTETIESIKGSENNALLHFNVCIMKASSENEVCKLKLEPFDNSKNIQDFQTFYAYIKKELIAVFK